jgi:hypothetical protein
MKLFQIEEPLGGVADPSLPGAAIGVDASGAAAEVAFSVGGNAVVLHDREDFAQILPVPQATASAAAWRALLEGARLRAERALARPVSHAVILLPSSVSPGIAEALHAAAVEAGIEILRLTSVDEVSREDAPALVAARLAEDLMPRPGTKNLAATYAT